MDLRDIKRRIFKDNKGNNVYMNVSVEEMDWLVEQAEENKINKTMLESSQGNTQAWVDKFNKLEKKYDQALTIITSKKIMEMQEKINTALYELEILHEKVSPTEHSSIDSHFKRIIGILKDE